MIIIIIMIIIIMLSVFFNSFMILAVFVCICLGFTRCADHCKQMCYFLRCSMNKVELICNDTECQYLISVAGVHP